ncbi:MAG: hypothetical protein K9M15_02145 [Candidatus Marinimicrobia bacterium]|nr:hypothetical protein [Candidatus Neomarinimicrobiota bacterium]
MDEQKFEQKITPQQEKEMLSQQIQQSPEKAKDIVETHLRKEANGIYLPGYNVSQGELSEIEKRIIDVGFEEKEKIIRELFSIVETKGMLNAVSVVKKLTPSLIDEFHDRLVEDLRKFENQ